MINKLIKQYNDWKIERKARINRVRALAHYMNTMTWMTERMNRDRNAHSWHKFKPRQSEFQKLVADFMAK